MWEIGPADNTTRCSGYSKSCLPHAWYPPQKIIMVLIDRPGDKSRVGYKTGHNQYQMNLPRVRIGQHYLDWLLVFFNKIEIYPIKLVEWISQTIDFISLRKKPFNQKPMTIFEIFIVCTASCISYQLGYINTIRRTRWNITWHEWKIDNVEVEVIAFVIQLGGKPFVVLDGKCQVQVIC